MRVKKPLRPDDPADTRQHIRKRDGRFARPAGHSRSLSRLGELAIEQYHHGISPQQAGDQSEDSLRAIALGGCQFQVCTACLARGCNGPPLCVSLDDLLRAQGDIGGKEILVPMCPCTIMDIHPADFHQGCTDPIPMARASDHLNGSGCAPIPRHGEAGSLGGLGDHCGWRAQFSPFDARASHRRRHPRWGRLRQRGIAGELTAQGEVTRGLAAKSCRLAGAIAGVTHQDELPVRKPAAAAGEQEPRQLCGCLMTCAMRLIPFGGTLPGD